MSVTPTLALTFKFNNLEKKFKFNIHIFRRASCVVAVSHYFLTMHDSYRTSFSILCDLFLGEELIKDSVLIF